MPVPLRVGYESDAHFYYREGHPFTAAHRVLGRCYTTKLLQKLHRRSGTQFTFDVFPALLISGITDHNESLPTRATSVAIVLIPCSTGGGIKNTMRDDIPPSGPWTGYYLYGHGGLKHRMRLGLTFTRDGKIRGEGVDDIAPFLIDGSFDGATSEAKWTKAYVGKHTVEYSGVYSQRAICGDWILIGLTGGFWIWPEILEQSEETAAPMELEQPLELVLK